MDVSGGDLGLTWKRGARYFSASLPLKESLLLCVYKGCTSFGLIAESFIRQFRENS